ncbi:beta strand repeat-containing protein [Almyronema epifaneia]|uniref:Beta strand repeat-containing protein n=1 Tax=Almyronema epifaneia S1 TaxID=2991925 RepID=A0ABW6IGX8_9CYAN
MQSLFKDLQGTNHRQQSKFIVVKKALSLAGTLLVSGSLIPSQLLFPIQTAYAQDASACPVVGKDGTGTISGIVNTYYAGASETVVAAGVTSIPVGAINPNGNQTPIQKGDLLIVIQMQDADINSTNTDAYGDGVGGDVSSDTSIAPPALGASGYTSLNNTGLYEYVIADGPISGGSIPIQGTTQYSYRNQTATATHGQRTYQVVRVPQYSSATVTGTLTTAAQWNGASGGIVAVDVAQQLTFAPGSVVDVNGLGFRGGGSNPNGDADNDNGGSQSPSPFRTTSQGLNQGIDAPKGEGIAGTPRIVSIQPFGAFNVRSSTVTTDLGAANYPNGDEGRGAPGNAGGGGNEHNSGGGGGANGGNGGRGGRSYNGHAQAGRTPPQYDVYVGGFGGKALSADPLRLMLGGGGGAGDTNDQAKPSGAGGGGGGMVIIRAGSISGNGVVNARGADGIDSPAGSLPDAGGGGGAGGTVLVATASGNVGGLTVNAAGGVGGDLNENNTVELDGPGGGGGGGVVYATGGITANLGGGSSGIVTNNTGSRNNTSNGATAGTAGVVQQVSLTDLTTSIAGSVNTCFDYGDAPDSYGTDKLAGNSGNSDPVGPSHTVVSGIYLGTTPPDREADAAKPLDGSGDGAEDDGITLPTLTDGDTSYTLPANRIVATGTGTLHAWVDFNNNNTFESGEYKSVAINAGTPAGDLTWSGIVVNGSPDSITYARFRFTSDPSLNANTPGGAASDGEVEDYQVAIAPSPSTGGSVCISPSSSTFNTANYSYNTPLQNSQPLSFFNGTMNFSAFLSGSGTWANGVQVQADGFIGDYLYLQPQTVPDYIPTNNEATYVLSFPTPLTSFSMIGSGLNSSDGTTIFASYQGTPIQITAANFSNLSPGMTLKDTNGDGQSDTVVSSSTTGGTDVNSNTYTLTISVPVDNITIISGKDEVGNNSTATIGLHTFQYCYEAAPPATDPGLRLVKRITAINGDRSQNPNDSTPLNTVVADPNSADDDDPGWPSGFLLGQINAGVVKPDDELEYTIYFLSSGTTDIRKVNICDLVPTYTTYVAGSGELTFGTNAPVSWDDSRNTDEGEYFAPNTTVAHSDVPGVGICRADRNSGQDFPSTENSNGALWVQVDKINTPLSAGVYGYIRFRVTVD